MRARMRVHACVRACVRFKENLIIVNQIKIGVVSPGGEGAKKRQPLSTIPGTFWLNNQRCQNRGKN